MKDPLILSIKELDGLQYIRRAYHNELEDAQSVLSLKFADEYCRYLLKYGGITAKKIELTGITNDDRLDVVYRTLDARKRINNFPLDMYVIEEFRLKKKVIAQNKTGRIYEITNKGKVKRIYDSLFDYIERIKD